MSEDNYPVVYEYADGRAGNWKIGFNQSSRFIRELLMDLPVGTELTIVEPGKTTMLHRRRRLHRHEVAERLLQQAESGPALLGQVLRDLGIRPDKRNE